MKNKYPSSNFDLDIAVKFSKISVLLNQESVNDVIKYAIIKYSNEIDSCEINNRVNLIWDCRCFIYNNYIGYRIESDNDGISCRDDFDLKKLLNDCKIIYPNISESAITYLMERCIYWMYIR